MTVADLAVVPRVDDTPALFSTSDLPTTVGEETRKLFDLWVETYRNEPRQRARIVLSDKRKRKINAALISHGYETCEAAVLGLQYSDWHMGDNPSGVKYDDIELILRDETKIERFARLYEENE